MHQESSHQHPKQNFQVERLAFFSDAVFAIAITLLIIEFKVPHVTPQTTVPDILRELFELRYQLVALLMSFYLIATYWVWHHFLFRHIHNYNQVIVVNSLVVLVPIIFFPFTTGFLAESVENKPVLEIAVRLFLVNNIIASGAIYALYWFATIHFREFSFEISPVERVKFNLKVLLPVIFFLILLIVNILHINENVFTGLLLLMVAARRYFGAKWIKKARAKEASKSMTALPFP